MARLLTERVDALGQTRRNSAEERKLIDELDALYDEGKKARDRWVKDVDLERDLRLYRGEGGPADRDPYFEANFIQAFIDRMVAQLTDNRPIIRVENKKLGLKKVAQVAQPVISAVWEDEKMQRQTFKMCHTAAINASAGLYTGYDMVTDSFVMEVLGIKQVVFDPMVKEAALVGSGDYLFIDRVRALDDLRARFLARGAEVKADAVLYETREQAKARTILSPLNDLLGRRSGQSEALPRAMVRECLINDRRRKGDGTLLFPGGRMILKTRDLILWDGPNPYWDGVPPIEWYDWIVDPEHPYGSSEPRRLMRLQLSFNQIMDGLVENQLLSNFLSVIGDHDALEPKVWEKLQKIAGSIIMRKRNRNAALTIQPPPVFGTDKINLSRAIFTFAQLLTGVTDVTLGETPGSLQSGQAIEGLQEGANLMTRSRASRLEDFFVRVGNKLLSRVFQFFPSDRVVHLVGPSGDAIEYAIKRQEFFVDDDGRPIEPEKRREALRYVRFLVSPGSSAPGSRLKRAQLMMDLYKAALAPGVDVLRAADFPNPEEMLKRAREERATVPPEVSQALAKSAGEKR